MYFFKENTNGRKATKLRNILPAVDLSGANRHFIICETHKILKKVLQKFTIKYPESDVYIVLQDHVGLLLKYLRENNDKIFYQELLAKLGAGEKVELLQSSPVECEVNYHPYSPRRLHIVSPIFPPKIQINVYKAKYYGNPYLRREAGDVWRATLGKMYRENKSKCADLKDFRKAII